MIVSGSVVEEIKSYFCLSEPYNVDAGRAPFAMKTAMRSTSLLSWVCMSSSHIVVIWYQPVTHEKSY